MTNKIQEIFAEACELDAAKRANYLRDACGNDSDLREQVESLLDAHDRAGKFMGNPTSEFVEPAATVSSLPAEPGKVIGRYKLLECIGEGGFGVVYMAQQSEPIRRRVALKIIKLGMDTKQVVARFEAERQALAIMDHPNIARVIDGGATDTGRPYFVMELVRGDPVTEYCDRERLAMCQRLELFQQVCQAVQHAHQKGIIHRDIKPSNVLVTISDDRPLVKVIDFGIAKATNSELTEKTLFTEFRQLIGTPQYMSPEQAERSGVDVDTRSDIYSLGVLLYEMLTGSTPIDPKRLGSAAWHELQRIICEEEPTRPSVAVSSMNVDTTDVAKRRSIEPSRLGGVLKGDLDWIVLKALEKDRSRRYATASQLADDIGRYLCDEPVEASPPSSAYKLSKFARRNKSLLTAASAVVVALLLGLMATTVMAAAAYRAQRLAEQALAKARHADHQAKESTRKARRSEIIAGGAVLLPDREATALADDWRADLVKQRSQTLTDDKPLVLEEAQFANWYGGWLLRHGKAAEAIELVAEHYDRAKQVLGQQDASFLSLCNTYAQAHIANDSPAVEIVPIYRDLLPVLEAIHGLPAATIVLPEFAAELARAGQHEEAASVIKTYLERHREADDMPTLADNLKLDLALNKLVQWGERHPDLYQQLQDFREVGVASTSADEADPELVRDAKRLQGTWEWTEVLGEVTSRMMVEISGSRTVTKFLNDEGRVEDGRSGMFKLSRSGAAKVYTSYVGSTPQSGKAFIYHLEKDRLFLVSGMLVNHGSLPDRMMRILKRVPAGSPSPTAK